MRIIHVFYDVHLGASHLSLTALLKAKTKKGVLPKGEFAVFLNKSWTGAKVLTGGGNLLYWRSPWGKPITPEELRYLPAAFGGSKFAFTGNLEDRLITLWNKRPANKPAQTAKEA